MACALSGAGTMPSVCAKSRAASNTLVCGTATASIKPRSYTWLISGAMPW